MINDIIAGGSRSIGLEFVRQLAERDDAPIVLATARKPKEAKDLNALAAKHSNIKVLEADLVKKFDSVAAEAKKHVDGVDVLIVNGAEFHFGTWILSIYLL